MSLLPSLLWLPFFFSECIYCWHIIVTSCYYMIFFLALFPPPIPNFRWTFPMENPSHDSSEFMEVLHMFGKLFQYFFIYVPVWFSTDFSIVSPYFSHIFPYSSTSIPNVNHQHRAPTSPSYRRWCPRSFWRTAWSLANVRRVLGKMMVGTKVTKICINHRYSQSIRYIYIYMICVYVCVYYIYIRIYSSSVFLNLYWCGRVAKKNYIYIYVCMYVCMYVYIGAYGSI